MTYSIKVEDGQVYIYSSEEEHGKPLIAWMTIAEFQTALNESGFCEDCEEWMKHCDDCERIDPDNPPDPMWMP
jgi:hypothetical protein